MNAFNIILLVSVVLLTTGCSVFSFKQHTINNEEAKSVATYNLSVLRYCDTDNTNFIYVDEAGKTTIRNLYLYMNDLNEDVSRAKACYEALTAYNQGVVDKLKD